MTDQVFSSENSGRVEKRARSVIWLTLFSIASITFLYLSVFTDVAFDRDYSDVYLYTYRDQNVMFWKVLAEIVWPLNHGFKIFYFINSGIFIALVLGILNKNPFGSRLVSVWFYTFSILWFGLGQLRYGTAVFMLALTLLLPLPNLIRFGIVFFSIYYHRILVVGLPVLLLALYCKSEKQNFLVWFLIVGVALTVSDDAVFQVVRILEYDDYSGWLSLERTYTWIKILLLSTTLLISTSGDKLNRFHIITFSLLFLLLSLYPVAAGRVYHLFIGAVVPFLASRLAKISWQTRFLLSLIYIYEIGSVLASETYYNTRG
jgi:hypothetical protein